MLATGSRVALTKSSTVPSCRKTIHLVPGHTQRVPVEQATVSSARVGTYGFPRNIFIITLLKSTGLNLSFQILCCSLIDEARHNLLTSFDTPAR